MTPIIRDRARAVCVQVREDLTTVAPTLAHLMRVNVNFFAPTSRAVAVRAYRAWQYGCTSIDVQRTPNPYEQEEA